MDHPACLIYTPGEPAGIGPDLIIALAQKPLRFPILIIANKALIEQRAQLLGMPIELLDWKGPSPAAQTPAKMYIQDVAMAAPCTAGILNPANAEYVLACLRQAVALCMSHQHFALVTGPLHKGNINDAGTPFSGHTEFLAQCSGTPLPVMMLATTGLRVALVTTHLPLANVAENITQTRLADCLRILHDDLVNKFGITTPRIAVCGLNPHAGESGHLGREEIEVITPVLETLRAQGYLLDGPIPADTAFTPARMQHTDAFLCMYHDQGLPVLKHVGFGNAINITLGLPFIRTSVDHGTALDLAGSGQADTGSLAAAMSLASTLLTD